MAVVVRLTFNPFQENTYLLYDDSRECIIIDPGMYHESERRILVNKITELKLTPVRLINTHCHLDHIFGNRFVADQYDLGLEIHKEELAVLEQAPVAAALFGVPYPDPSPRPTAYLSEQDKVRFGNTELEILFVPGHSPASLAFYSRADGWVIGGDVLFQGSIGRTDLPGGDYHTLIRSIHDQLLPLGDEVIVYPGHGPETTIGTERRSNSFLK